LAIRDNCLDQIGLLYRLRNWLKILLINDPDDPLFWAALRDWPDTLFSFHKEEMKAQELWKAYILSDPPDLTGERASEWVSFQHESYTKDDPLIEFHLASVLRTVDDPVARKTIANSFNSISPDRRGIPDDVEGLAYSETWSQIFDRGVTFTEAEIDSYYRAWSHMETQWKGEKSRRFSGCTVQ
jgi:hypothetical protein